MLGPLVSFIVPILVVLEVGPVLAEVWLLDDVILSQLVPKVVWPVGVEKSSIGEVNVAVSACTIGLSSWNVFRPISSE